MWETSARLLRLLSLLQSRPEWTGAELAERLGVDRRTVRRDVDRLRALGCPVDASPGVPGYRLGAGAKLPPLLLDDEEAVAVAVGLRTAAGGTVAGIEEASLRALTKLEQVLPSALRHRINLLHSATVTVPAGGPTVRVEQLTAIAAAIRDRLRLRFDYRRHDGTEALRVAEPHRLVHTGRRWYLVGWDVERADWRTYRVDRLHPRTPAGPRFEPREAPDVDLAAYLARGVSTEAYRYRALVTLAVAAEVAVDAIPPTIGVIEAVDAGTCRLHVGGSDLAEMALYLGLLGFPLTVHEPPELIDVVRVVAERLRRAVPG